MTFCLSFSKMTFMIRPDVCASGALSQVFGYNFLDGPSIPTGSDGGGSIFFE